MPGFKFPRCVS